jgi:carbamoyltransferase
MDGAFYKSFLAEQPHLYTDRLVSLLGGRIGYSGEKPDEWHFSVAKAMQKVSEEVAFNMLKELYRITKCRNLVLGGGFFMNSVFNGKVAGNSDFRNVYISYAPADLGNSIGAALYVAHCLKRAKRDHRPCSSLIGPEFTDSQIEQSLIRRKIQYEYVRNRDRRIAELLSQGEIVAVMNGRMEFGERALGNRSILADPRRSDIKDRVNSAIKYRESYRPFAPAAIREKAHIYFEVEKGYECRHMEKVVRVRKEYGEKLPAITHADGSARLQTVERAENGPFYGVLIEFEKLTGFPIVLNTSFNINKEPIVLNPDDALNTFFNSGLEYLFIGPYLIRKKER